MMRKRKLSQYKNSFPVVFFNSKIVIVSGGFDPIHSGHINYIKAAKKAAGSSILLVGLNSDEWLKRKKGTYFMPFEERAAILNNIVGVDSVIAFKDDDNTAIELIKKVRRIYPEHPLVVCNGGDRTEDNNPDADDEQIKNDKNLKFLFGIGGSNKANSSSWILDQYKAPKTQRDWGYYRVLREYDNEIKLKELVVNPGDTLSMQRHKQRKEFWFIAEGEASVYSLDIDGNRRLRGNYNKFDILDIMNGEWHQLVNGTQEPLKVIEIQYGENCIEEDIERL